MDFTYLSSLNHITQIRCRAQDRLGEWPGYSSGAGPCTAPPAQSDCEERLVTILLHLQLEVVHEGPVFLVDNAVGDEEADKAHTDQAQTHKQKPLSLTRLMEI